MITLIAPFNRNLIFCQLWMLYFLMLKPALKNKMQVMVCSSAAEPKLVLSLALLGKLCILSAIFIGILYSIELFPTMVRYACHMTSLPCWHHILVSSSSWFRQRCISLVNLSYRMGCLANSLFPSHPNGVISVAAVLVYSSGPIIGSGLCLMLPETSGTPLPDSVEDCYRQPLPVLFTCGPSDRWGMSIAGDTAPSFDLYLL